MNSNKLSVEIKFCVSTCLTVFCLFICLLSSIQHIQAVIMLSDVIIIAKTVQILKFPKLTDIISKIVIIACGIAISIISDTWICCIVLLAAGTMFDSIIVCLTDVFILLVDKSFSEKALLQLFLLALICFAIRYFETILNRYISREKQISEALSSAAVNELNEKLLNRELIVKNSLIERNARLEERETISRNIHNSVGHTITSAIMALDASQMLYPVSPDNAMKKVEVADERMRESLDKIRNAVRVLDKEVTEISVNDMMQMLITTIDSFVVDTEISVRHNLKHIETDSSVEPKFCEFLNGALSEALTNGVKHGKATAFLVMLTCDSTHVKLTVSDNGNTFSSLTPLQQNEKLNNGFGLKKINKFALDNCGAFSIRYDDGFEISVTLPLIDTTINKEEA